MSLFLKRLLAIHFFLITFYSQAQEIIFSDNFEQNKIDSSSWHIVSGNWRIGYVDDIRIAPAENGYSHVLLSGGNGYTGEQIIRLMVIIPDTLKTKKIRLGFSYYILVNAPGIKMEIEFYEKEIKDGLRRKLWSDDLLRYKGRWKEIQKILNIPAKVNIVYITFFGLESSGIKDRMVCFDNIVVASLK